jgi:hypothetical protein
MWKPWTEVDWEAPRPTLDDVLTSHRRIRFTRATVNSPGALRLVDTFRSILTNGGAHIAAFTVDDVDDTAHWFLSRNRFGEYGFIKQLLTSDALTSALPDLVPIDANPMDANFEESSALLLDGQLAGALVWGGPYGKFDGSEAEAKRVGVEVCSELIGDRYEDFRVDRSHGSWADWFHAVAWDCTWVITDKRNERVTLLCITDTD